MHWQQHWGTMPPHPRVEPPCWQAGAQYRMHQGHRDCTSRRQGYFEVCLRGMQAGLVRRMQGCGSCWRRAPGGATSRRVTLARYAASLATVARHRHSRKCRPAVTSVGWLDVDLYHRSHTYSLLLLLMQMTVLHTYSCAVNASERYSLHRNSVKLSDSVAYHHDVPHLRDNSP